MMGKFILFLFCLNLITFGAVSQSTWELDPESTITILGQSNVNTFECRASLDKRANTWKYIRVGIEKNSKYITLPVKHFDCGNNRMNKDFRNALHAETYPKIGITFKALAPIPESAGKEKRIKGKVKIDLAGTCRNFDIQFEVKQNKKDEIHLTGNYMLAFSDFNLEPPTKFWGMVEVRDEIQVAFRLIFKK